MPLNGAYLLLILFSTSPATGQLMTPLLRERGKAMKHNKKSYCTHRQTIEILELKIWTLGVVNQVLLILLLYIIG